MKNSVLLIAALLLTISCTAWKAQHDAVDTGTTRSAEAAAKIQSDEELLERFRAQPIALKQSNLIAQLDDYKQELAAAGKYDCCVSPSCNECAINSGECHCRRVVEKNGPCCGECTQGWIEGRGDVVGVDREQILEHLGCVRELYEKPVPEGETAPGAIVRPE